MNLGELYAELRLLLGNVSSSAISDTRLTLWLNNAETELASAFQFFSTEKRATASMSVGQTEYSLPTDCIAIYDLRDNTEKRKIRRAHYRKFDNIDVSVTGDPSHYIRYGNYLVLYPTPDATNTMQLRYCKTLTAMSTSTSTPTLPAPWHECILLGAEYRGWRAVGEYKRAALAKNEYLSMVRSRSAEWEIEDSDEEFGLEVVR